MDSTDQTLDPAAMRRRRDRKLAWQARAQLALFLAALLLIGTGGWTLHSVKTMQDIRAMDRFRIGHEVYSCEQIRGAWHYE